MQEPSLDRPLERLWAGDFGDAYAERNADADRGRAEFWSDVLERLAPTSVLEVGCNVGGNLRWIAESVEPSMVAGIDVNSAALSVLSERLPEVDARLATGRDLPYADESFDLVFTTGVLIHQASGDLEAMMKEIVRCSRRWILCGEYADDHEVEVPYRGQPGALFRRDYGSIYKQLAPSLSLAESGFLPRSAASTWDDLTWWIFEKPAS